MIIFNMIIKSTFITYILIFISLKLFSIATEMIYRKVCFPLNTFGFFFSIFSSTSDACLFLRTTSNNVNIFFVHLISTFVTQTMQQCINYLRIA